MSTKNKTIKIVVLIVLAIFLVVCFFPMHRP
jgi:regulatory protein YycI of two-component signal transduction system YycFG